MYLCTKNELSRHRLSEVGAQRGQTDTYRQTDATNTLPHLTYSQLSFTCLIRWVVLTTKASHKWLLVFLFCRIHFVGSSLLVIVVFLLQCIWNSLPNAMVTFEIKLFQNYFSLRRRPTEIILFQHMETSLKLVQNYFWGWLQLINIFQRVRCRWNNFEIISAAEIILSQFQTWSHVK